MASHDHDPVWLDRMYNNRARVRAATPHPDALDLG